MTGVPMAKDDKGNIDDEVIARFIATRSRESSTRERMEFARWTAESEERSRAVDDLRRLDSDLDSLSALYADEVSALARPSRLPRSRWVTGLAAACIAALGLVFVATGSRTVSASDGTPVNIALWDGSRVHLDAGATLRIPYAPWSRHLSLVGGDAIFDVVHDQSRPFAVTVGRVVITDIGTRFLVRAEGDGVQVAVYEGAIELDPGTGAQPLPLPAATAMIVSAEGIVRTVPVPNEATTTAWRHGRLVFDNTPLADVAGRLSRYRGDKVVIGSPAIAGLRVSGSFDLRNRTELLRAIELTLPVTVRKMNGEVVLMPAPPRTIVPPKIILP